MEDLTPEQLRALVETHCREWREVAVRRGPADRARAQGCIGELYAGAGYKRPSFIWHESPRGLLATLLTGSRLAPLLDSLRRPLQLDSEYVARSLFQPLPSAFEGLLGLIFDSLPAPSGKLLLKCLNEISVGLELDRIVYHDFCQRHLDAPYKPARVRQIRLWSEIARACYWWAPYESFCLASDPPAMVSMDRQERPHSVTGPAMTFSDGWSLYAIHGWAASERLIMAPDEVTLEDLPFACETEVLRATIELLGCERFLAAGRAQLVHEDAFGKLYRIHLPPYEPLVMVAAANAIAEPDGSSKRHLLRVPPDTKTAREALAWTLGRHASNYAPKLQT
jgi:Domain of unknown function (DUF6745)